MDEEGREQDDHELDMPRRRELSLAEIQPQREIQNLIDDAIAGLQINGVRIKSAYILQGPTQDVGHLCVNGKMAYTIVVQRNEAREIIAYEMLTPFPPAILAIPGVR